MSHSWPGTRGSSDLEVHSDDTVGSMNSGAVDDLVDPVTGDERVVDELDVGLVDELEVGPVDDGTAGLKVEVGLESDALVVAVWGSVALERSEAESALDPE